MTRSRHASNAHVANFCFISLAFIAMACGDDRSTVPEGRTTTKSPVVSATPAASFTTVSAPAIVEPVTPVTDVPRTVSFGSADDAYKAGDYRTATRMYRSQLEGTPNDGHGHYMLGLSSWKSGDFDGANKAFDRSIELNPGFAKSYFNQGRVLLDLNRVGEALEVIEKGRTIDSTSGDGLRLVARAKAEGGDVDGAISTYRELLVRDETDVWGLNNLGMLLFERGDIEGALGPLARAVQVRPTAPLFLNNLGMALERQGHLVAALRRYELAVQHDSGYVKSVRNAERLKGVVTDSTLTDEVSVNDLAESFRQTVRGWKVESPTP
jgi:tetratricopeptide (TPR) repeat protein